uniref:FAM3 metabolism regulating signaling molecule D n=1 Tax=Amphiprion percula TaxID=161767 RepID=A0A3P8SZ71_AMPPE
MLLTAALHLAAVIVVLLITWGISINSFDAQEKVETFLATTASVPKCRLSRLCPPQHFALHIRSGAANVVGPNICFDGKIIMSHVLNNVGPGLNIVVVNGESGVVEKSHYLDMNAGKDILAYLKEIKPGMIVLVASFDDVTKKMTDEMREIFVGMGSALIKSVKHRDSWVFAGRAGAKSKSLFEKQAAHDEKTNIYEGWPEMVEVAGCFPRNQTDRLTD